MTREEAKNWLNKLYVRIDITDEYGDMEDMQPYEEAVNMAIKALEQEPCEDAVSRQDVMDLLQNETEEVYITSKGRTKISIAEIDVEDLESLPSVSVAEKVGCWVEIDDEPHEVWECDHCGFVIDGSGCIDPYEYRDTYKYCPNCGARMREVEE